jgi:ribosomal protein S18 acetylase RimI-like enzyme
MKPADRSHKALVVEILAKSFDDNQSINFIVRQDRRRMERIKDLMAYCFDICLMQGQAFLSDDGNAGVLIRDPLKKGNRVKTGLLDLGLAFQSIGLHRVSKVARREKLIKKYQPKDPFYYLWFIGVNPDAQGKGTGSNLLREVLQYYEPDKRPFYLETSVLRNLPWYEKFGFKIYNEIDLGYKLYQMIRN